MKRFLLALLLIFPFTGCAQTSSDYRRSLERYEGYSEVPYRDNGGYTVGIGHRIYGDVKDVYTSEEIETLFYADLSRNLKSCRQGIKDFSQLPKEIREVCLGVAWTVGEKGFWNFRKFRAAISVRDYNTAAKELEDSKWYHQVARSRARDYIDILNHVK